MLLGNDKHEEPLMLPWSSFWRTLLQGSPASIYFSVTRECLPGEGILPEQGLIKARLERDCRA
jgi:hypothetical protein